MNPPSNVALVTGGGTGVGRAAVLQLAARGYDVVINYSRSKSEAEATAALARERGVRAIAMACDVSDDGQVRAMIDACRREFGRLDVVVNNAATTWFIPHADLEALTEDKWDRILAVNLKGPFFVTRAAVPFMQESGGGAIVNVASVAGIGGSGSSIAYAASKGALITMTKSLARSPRQRGLPWRDHLPLAGRSSRDDRLGRQDHAAGPRLDHRRRRRGHRLPRLRRPNDDRPGPGGRWRPHDVKWPGR